MFVCDYLCRTVAKQKVAVSLAVIAAGGGKGGVAP